MKKVNQYAPYIIRDITCVNNIFYNKKLKDLKLSVKITAFARSAILSDLTNFKVKDILSPISLKEYQNMLNKRFGKNKYTAYIMTVIYDNEDLAEVSINKTISPRAYGFAYHLVFLGIPKEVNVVELEEEFEACLGRRYIMIGVYDNKSKKDVEIIYHKNYEDNKVINTIKELENKYGIKYDKNQINAALYL